MKKFHLSLFLTITWVAIIFTGNPSFGQAAKTSVSKTPVYSAINFYNIRDNFYNKWSKFQVDRNGYYFENGEEKRVPGYKQFKRWEWYWETRVDKNSGDFPETRASDIFMQV